MLDSFDRAEAFSSGGESDDDQCMTIRYPLLEMNTEHGLIRPSSFVV